MMRAPDHPNVFPSFGLWEGLERISEWRARPECAAFVQEERSLCDEIQPRTMKVVAQVPDD